MSHSKPAKHTVWLMLVCRGGEQYEKGSMGQDYCCAREANRPRCRVAQTALQP
jgi:hypothetical protein